MDVEEGLVVMEKKDGDGNQLKLMGSKKSSRRLKVIKGYNWKITIR